MDSSNSATVDSPTSSSPELPLKGTQIMHLPELKGKSCTSRDIGRGSGNNLLHYNLISNDNTLHTPRMVSKWNCSTIKWMHSWTFV